MKRELLIFRVFYLNLEIWVGFWGKILGGYSQYCMKVADIYIIFNLRNMFLRKKILFNKMCACVYLVKSCTHFILFSK